MSEKKRDSLITIKQRGIKSDGTVGICRELSELLNLLVDVAMQEKAVKPLSRKKQSRTK